MLQKVERYVLKMLSKQPKAINYTPDKFPRYSKDDILCAMESLESKGYLKSVSGNIDLSSLHCELTTQGIFYKEYRRQCFISNIFIPIVVSIIATLVTTFLCG